MANENEKNPSALEELRRLKRTDRIKSLDIHEPELHDFNAENIFHIDEEPEKKTIFGKRSARTHVKINENIFDDEVAESVDITPSTSIEEVEAPIEKHVVEESKVDDKPLVEEEPKFIEEKPKFVEEEPKFVEEEPKKIVVEKLDVDDDFTTESIAPLTAWIVFFAVELVVISEGKKDDIWFISKPLNCSKKSSSKVAHKVSEFSPNTTLVILFSEI
mgnify:CR=1 FL=1